MKLSVISFTENGRRLSQRVARNLGDLDVDLYAKGSMKNAGRNQKDLSEAYNEANPVQEPKVSVGEWTKSQMEEKNALLFIGACGIAVRAIAPHIRDKMRDSAVLVMDEKGRYVIPILSGHMGGANELALLLSKRMGAEAVITTATDINGVFAVDLFAKRNGLFIVDREGIAKVSAKALAGKEITISIEEGHRKDGDFLPAGVRIREYPPKDPVDVAVTSKPCECDRLILLRPREYVIGMGCRKGKEAKQIERLVMQKLLELGIGLEQVFSLVSISQKENEKGMVTWSKSAGLPFFTYTAKELMEVAGEFASSDFVSRQVGVDNVCERAALKGCGAKGRLILKKYAKDGMTIAIAKRQWKVAFDGK